MLGSLQAGDEVIVYDGTYNRSGYIAGDPAVGVAVDFNWDPRDSAPDIGAYEWQAGGNPGWDVGPGFRDTDGGVPPAPDAGPSPDGGSPGSDGGTGDPNADDGGCGCRTTPASGGTLGLILLLLWIRRRRR